MRVRGRVNESESEGVRVAANETLPKNRHDEQRVKERKEFSLLWEDNTRVAANR